MNKDVERSLSVQFQGLQHGHKLLQLLPNLRVLRTDRGLHVSCDLINPHLTRVNISSSRECCGNDVQGFANGLGSNSSLYGCHVTVVILNQVVSNSY